MRGWGENIQKCQYKSPFNLSYINNRTLLFIVKDFKISVCVTKCFITKCQVPKVRQTHKTATCGQGVETSTPRPLGSRVLFYSNM